MLGNSKYDELQRYVEKLESRVKELEASLKENREKTERLKSSLLSNISHELRTPMNAILGFSNLMIDKNLSPEKKEEYMEHISMNSSSLLSLVDSMIDVSLLEINELKINKEKFNLDKSLQQIYHYHNIEKHKMGKDHVVLLFNQYKNEEDFIIYTDPFRLTQVLSNLLHNAFKFTRKGVVEFGYILRKDKKLQFYVKDSGKGILAEKAAFIFDKFEKLDPEKDSIDSGLGLGLTLAKGLVGLLGGEIWVESNIFKGSTFHFTIEYEVQKQEKPETKKTLQSIFV